MPARRVPRRPPEAAASEHRRESFGGAFKGRSAVPLPVRRDRGTPDLLGTATDQVLAYQDVFTLSGGAESVELTYLPLLNSEHVYLNGVYQREGSAYDWTRAAGTRTVNIDADMDARSGDVLVVEYLYYLGTPVDPLDLGAAAYVANASLTGYLTSDTPSLPAGAQNGDLLLVLLVQDYQGNTWSGLSGWTEVGKSTSSGSAPVTVGIYSQVYDSGSFVAPTVTIAGAGLHAMYAFRNAEVDASSTWASSASSTSHTSSGVTAGAANALIVPLIGANLDYRSENLSCASLPNLESNRDSGIKIGGGQISWTTSRDTLAAGGATGAISFTTSVATDAASVIVSLK